MSTSERDILPGAGREWTRGDLSRWVVLTVVQLVTLGDLAYMWGKLAHVL